METKKTITLLTLLFIFGIVEQAFSQEGWKQYRGPDRTAKISEKLPLNAEGKIQAELLWKNNLGPGFSEISIDGKLVYAQYGEKIDSLSGLEYLVAFDALTGKEEWKTTVDSIYIEIDKWGDGPRSTPATDESNIYSLSGLGKLSSHNKMNGELIWQIDFQKDFGSERPRWGFASSPILIDDMLLIVVGGTEEQAFMAFDKNNGSIIWTKGKGISAYNSPILTSINGQEQLISVHAGAVHSYTLKGDTLWNYKIPIGAVIAMPMQIEDNKFFFSNASKGFVIMEVVNNVAKEVLKGNSMKNDFMTSVYHDGFLYGYHIAALRCMDVKTGETKWQKRGFGKGSLIMVDDKLVILSDKGKLAIANVTPEAYQEAGSIQALDRSRAWTSPSFSDGRVYVRNLNEIACYKLK